MDDSKLAAARADIPYLANGIYVDNASVSPMSKRMQLASQRFDTLISEQLREHKTIVQASRYGRSSRRSGAMSLIPSF